MFQRAAVAGHEAGARGDTSHGAVLVDPFGSYVHTASDTTKSAFDPTGHASINLLREAAHSQRRMTFEGYAVVLSHEPCTMCAGALIEAEIRAIFYGEEAGPGRDPHLPLARLVQYCSDPVHVDGGLRLPKEEMA